MFITLQVSGGARQAERPLHSVGSKLLFRVGPLAHEEGWEFITGEIAIIGAGLSGVVLGRCLQADGRRVDLYEKSRGPGGRLSTRRLNSYQFDHGAQYFTARSQEFRDFIQPYLASGIVTSWRPRLVRLGQSKAFRSMWFEPHFLASPCMNSWVKELASELSVRSEWRVASADRRDGKWWLTSDAGALVGPYDYVFSTAPAEQTSALLPWLAQELESVEMQPCFAWMLGFQKPPIKFSWEAAQVSNSPISWICCQNSRSRRPGSLALVIHSSNGWASENFDRSPRELEVSLGTELLRLCGIDWRLAECTSLHRWRYASTRRDLGQDFVLDIPRGLAACGDWCRQGRVEGAFLSAVRLAEFVGREMPSSMGFQEMTRFPPVF